MKHKTKKTLKNRECHFYTKRRNSYSYYRIFTDTENNTVSRFSIGNNLFEYCWYKPSRTEVAEIIDNGISLDEKYSDFFSSIYPLILTAVKSVLNSLIKDEELRDLIDDEKFEFFLATWDADDSFTASEDKIGFCLNDRYLKMEHTFCSGYDNDYVPNPPYLFEVHFFDNKSNSKGDYKTTITEDVYIVVNSTLRIAIEVLSEVCYTFDRIFKERGNTAQSESAVHEI